MHSVSHQEACIVDSNAAKASPAGLTRRARDLSVVMDSSRIFIKNLPPNGITEAQLRKHFTAHGQYITDVRLIPRRRIGYVGYKTPEDAAEAVRYFNRSFIRMSRVTVELAKPVRFFLEKSQHL